MVRNAPPDCCAVGIEEFEQAAREPPRFLGRDRVHLLDGVGEEVAVALRTRHALLGFGQRRRGVAPGPMGGARGLQHRRRRRIGIEQRAVGGFVGEAHLLVLALNLDQQPREPPQQPIGL